MHSMKILAAIMLALLAIGGMAGADSASTTVQMNIVALYAIETYPASISLTDPDADNSPDDDWTGTGSPNLVISSNTPWQLGAYDPDSTEANRGHLTVSGSSPLKVLGNHFTLTWGGSGTAGAKTLDLATSSAAALLASSAVPVDSSSGALSSIQNVDWTDAPGAYSKPITVVLGATV